MKVWENVQVTALPLAGLVVGFLVVVSFVPKMGKMVEKSVLIVVTVVVL